MLAAGQELQRSRPPTTAAMPAARTTRSAPVAQLLSRTLRAQSLGSVEERLQTALHGRLVCFAACSSASADRRTATCVQCNIWTFCNPETGDGCDNTCEPATYNYSPSNPTDPLRFGQSSAGCLPGNQWPKCAPSPPPSLSGHACLRAAAPAKLHCSGLLTRSATLGT